MISYVAAFLDVFEENIKCDITTGRFFFTGSIEAHRLQDNKSIAQWWEHISTMI
uniref:Bm411 n=1 Tax=Brugia malayi TaxID=6279 RepID=A0A0K0JD85_BRUMA|nr:Bm411 [Brugia malayi]